MSSLRSRLKRQICLHTESVEHDGDTFIVSGIPSTSLMLETSVPDPSDKNLATLWNVMFCPGIDGAKLVPMPETFKAKDIGQIKVVQHYVKAPEGEDPYDLPVIAEIFATDPLLFAKLYGASMKCMTASNPVEVAAGKSPAGEPAT